MVKNKLSATDRKPRIAAIGTFDGVHRGHKSVLKAMTDYAKEHDMEALAVTFNCHPLSVIDPDRTPEEITSLHRKKRLLGAEGVACLVLDFDENLRATTASDWIRHLRDEYGVGALVVGYDNTFGCDGIDYSLDDYRRLGCEEGVEVISAEEIPDVSSSAIRKAIKVGDIDKVNNMLGRNYSLSGMVIDGNKLGRTIGFPTANISPVPGVAIPKNGVYSAAVKLPGETMPRPAMVNIGTRPTVRRGDDRVVEVHVIGWEGDLYGREINVSFLKRLRDEKKFDSIDDLRRQLAADREQCLAKTENNNKTKI